MKRFISPSKNQHRSLRIKDRRLVDARPAVRVSLRLLMLAAVLVFGIGYLVLSNHVATKGFVMKDFQSQIETLTQTNEALEVQVMDLQSLNNLQNASSNLDLVSISKMEYLSNTEPTFALRGGTR